jgi:hypothetical protein
MRNSSFILLAFVSVFVSNPSNGQTKDFDSVFLQNQIAYTSKNSIPQIGLNMKSNIGGFLLNNNEITHETTSSFYYGNAFLDAQTESPFVGEVQMQKESDHTRTVQKIQLVRIEKTGRQVSQITECSGGAIEMKKNFRSYDIGACESVDRGLCLYLLAMGDVATVEQEKEKTNKPLYVEDLKAALNKSKERMVTQLMLVKRLAMDAEARATHSKSVFNDTDKFAISEEPSQPAAIAEKAFRMRSLCKKAGIYGKDQSKPPVTSPVPAGIVKEPSS